MDIGFEGVPWTWTNLCEDKNEIKERLNRSLSSGKWAEYFGSVKILHIENEASDHCMLLLNTNLEIKHRKQRFCFDRRWLEHEEV